MSSIITNPLPYSSGIKYQFAKREPQILYWTITALQPDGVTIVPVDDCDSVVASLYAGRNIDYPDDVPGTVLPEFSGLVLVDTGAGTGTYKVAIASGGSTFNPPPSANYVLVVDATRDGQPFGHWEQQAEVYVNS
jgi:hypothetical protein